MTMTKKDPRAKGASWVCACFVVKDMKRSIDFYQKAFGFEIKEKHDGPDGECMHVEMKYKDILLMFGQEGKHGCPMQTPKTSKVDAPLSLYLYCENVDEMYKKAVAAGAESLSAPEDAFWGDRWCQVKDPDGYSWGLGTNFGECDMSKMEEFCEKHAQDHGNKEQKHEHKHGECCEHDHHH